LQVSPDRDSLISNGYHNNLRCSQVVLSCQYYNQKPICDDFRYPKFHKNQKAIQF